MLIPFMNKFLLNLALLLMAQSAWARPILKYTGEARAIDKILYIEKHEVTHDESGKILRSKTEYFDNNQKALAVLTSDYAHSTTTPDYVFEDFRNKSKNGVRNTAAGIVMFNHDAAKDEDRVTLPSEGKDKRLVFGCQGFNYYVLENLEALKAPKSIPIKFLMPGGLEAYNFVMKMKDVTPDGTLNVEIQIESFFLRLFAPKLYIQYDTLKKRIIWYQGLSNLNDEKGQPQNVTITYQYDS